MHCEDSGGAIEDREIVQSVRAGHTDAYAHLVRQYQERVLRLCTALLRDRTLAEDAAQDIFLKAYQALHAFRGDAAFSTWLYRIAANHCKDLLRRRVRERTESWDALLEAHGEPPAEVVPSSEHPATAVANTELAAKILARLSPDYRIILTLREVQGLSYGELAATLRCSVDAVKARLRRARQELQEILRHFPDARDV